MIRIKYKELIGKRALWEDIVKAFPDKRVALRDCEFGEFSNVISRVVVIICHDWEMGEEIKKLSEVERKSELCWRRTTVAKGVK